MQFIDPHFHYWDITPKSVTGHNPQYLGDIGKKIPVYTPTHYIEHMKRTGLHLKKAVFVEAISDDPLRESKWVVDVSSRPEAKGVQHAFVFNAPLHRPDAENLLKEYAKNPSIVGIRQIVNHHPSNPNLTWPKIDQDFLKNEQWKKNFSLLARYNFSFDLQLNPHQMKTAAEIISRNPEIPVIVDHIGSLFLGNSDEENKRTIETWREGLKALSLLPNVTVKLSMLGFTKSGWEKKRGKQENYLRICS